MEAPDNPIAIYNDFLRASLSFEDHSRTLLEGIAAVTGETIEEEEVYELAQCLALADWSQEKGLPHVLRVRGRRHQFRGVIHTLVEREVLLLMGGGNNEQLLGEIEALRERCIATLDRAKTFSTPAL